MTTYIHFVHPVSRQSENNHYRSVSQTRMYPTFESLSWTLRGMRYLSWSGVGPRSKIHSRTMKWDSSQSKYTFTTKLTWYPRETTYNSNEHQYKGLEI